MGLRAPVLLAFSIVAIPLCFADAPKPDAEAIHRSFAEKDATIATLRGEVADLKKQLSPTPPMRLNKDDGPDPPQARAIAWRIRAGEARDEVEAELGPPTLTAGTYASGTMDWATSDGWANAGIINGKVLFGGFSPIFPDAGAYPRAQMWYAVKKGAQVLDK